MDSCFIKICTKCKESKPFNEFGKAKLGKDGLRSICKTCHSNQNSEWQKKNINSRREYQRKRAEEKGEELSAKRTIYNLKHKEERARKSKEYRLANPGKINAKTAKRRQSKRKRTPPWLTEEHWKQIEAFYVESSRLTKETGIPHEVDHIVPIQGKDVSGLHVPWNLRVITRNDNRRKSRKF